MKISCLAFLLLVLLSATSKKADGNRDFKVISAEKVSAFGGVSGSPVVTTYSICLKAKRRFLFQADSAWAEGKIDNLVIDLDSFTTAKEVKVKRGDIVWLHFEIKTEAEMGGGDYQIKIPGSPESTPKIDYKKGGLLRYGGGKCKYLLLSNIVMRETLFYP